MHLRHSLKARIDRLKPTKPDRLEETDESMRKHVAYKKKKKVWTNLHRKRRLFFKSIASLEKPKSMEAKEARFVTLPCNRNKGLHKFRLFILHFYPFMHSH